MANLRVNKIAAVGVSTETAGSVYFDGTGDYLSVGRSGDCNFLHNGATDWTVEFWAYTGAATRQFARLWTCRPCYEYEWPMASADVDFSVERASVDRY